MSRFDRRTFVKALGSAGGVGAIAGCLGALDDDDDVEFPDPLVLGHASPVFPIFHFANYPFFEDIIEEEEGVSVEFEIFSGYTGMVAGYLSDEFHIGYMTLGSLLGSRAEGFPAVFVNGFITQYNFPMVVRPEVIDDWGDIEGGTVWAHSPLSGTAAAARVMVEEELGDPDAVDFDFMFGFDTRMSAMDEGEIDAHTVSLGAAIQAERDGYGEILASPWDYERMEGHCVEGWVVLEDDLEENTELFQKIVDYQRQAYEEAYEADPADAAERARDTGHYVDFDEGVWEEAFEIAQNVGMWPENSGIRSDQIEPAQDVLVETDLIDEEVKADNVENLTDERLL